MSIWGPVVGESVAERDADIDALIALNRFNGGNKITHKTISYLDDRYYLSDFVAGYCIWSISSLSVLSSGQRIKDAFG